MTNTVTPQPQAVGPQFSLSKMLHARDRTFAAIDRIAEQIHPGMTEQQAKTLAKTTLDAMGMDRIWHGIIIRFGSSTLKTFRQKNDPENVLREDDIFFIDLGVVWDGHEGDSGASFVVGDDAQMQACAHAAQALWQQVSDWWQQTGCAGTALYDYAAEQAAAMGWQLNLDVKGHRVSDFPHAIYQAGDLGDFAACPDTGLWILEIQIRHPTLPYGAFYEDLLVRQTQG
ncbi:M24 family metallopeptidase [Aquitalea denitrificans]|uniref:M24 family metallopeptidase n=1 Tax=Aquitalea denitrificans TaxID=519081 RepID=UPI0013576B24|nr:M24 family metallopeptidase [Aquitalea denitrificans]